MSKRYSKSGESEKVDFWLFCGALFYTQGSFIRGCLCTSIFVGICDAFYRPRRFARAKQDTFCRWGKVRKCRRDRKYFNFFLHFTSKYYPSIHTIFIFNIHILGFFYVTFYYLIRRQHWINCQNLKLEDELFHSFYMIFCNPEKQYIFGKGWYTNI